MMSDLWSVYSGERFRTSGPSCFLVWTENFTFFHCVSHIQDRTREKIPVFWVTIIWSIFWFEVENSLEEGENNPSWASLCRIGKSQSVGVNFNGQAPPSGWDSNPLVRFPHPAGCFHSCNFESLSAGKIREKNRWIPIRCWCQTT